MTHEDAQRLSAAIDDALACVRDVIGTLGYADNVIDFEIGLQLARRATRHLDPAVHSQITPVNGHSNGVDKP